MFKICLPSLNTQPEFLCEVWSWPICSAFSRASPFSKNSVSDFLCWIVVNEEKVVLELQLKIVEWNKMLRGLHFNEYWKNYRVKCKLICIVFEFNVLAICGVRKTAGELDSSWLNPEATSHFWIRICEDWSGENPARNYLFKNHLRRWKDMTSRQILDFYW